jgi:hypothetical protein
MLWSMGDRSIWVSNHRSANLYLALLIALLT